MKYGFYHFSETPLTSVRSVAQDTDPAYKPNGFWVSIGMEWKQFCEREEFNLDTLATCTKVELKKSAHILYITNVAEFDAFNEKFVRYNELGDDMINWGRVAMFWDGIVIAPYIGDRRLTSSWYYTWDIASGCIWNSKAVKSFGQ